MNITANYDKYWKTVINEHTAVFEKQDLKELEKVLKLIIQKERIFVMGVGREGIAARSFAMRLMHLGKEVHWIWDDTTPGMHKDDLFIVVNGSGKIGHIHYVVQQAKKAGTTVVVVTGSPKAKTAKLADQVLFIPASVFNGTDKRVVPSIQPMGNLFEQHEFLLFDIMIMLLGDEIKVPYEEMEARHRNIE